MKMLRSVHTYQTPLGPSASRTVSLLGPLCSPLSSLCTGLVKTIRAYLLVLQVNQLGFSGIF